jgi:hypothetical protein
MELEQKEQSEQEVEKHGMTQEDKRRRRRKSQEKEEE